MKLLPLIQENIKKNEYDIIYSDKNLLVIVPLTKEASCRFGAGTKWCTADKNLTTKSAFDSWNDRCHLFRFVFKKLDRKIRLTYCIDESNWAKENAAHVFIRKDGGNPFDIDTKNIDQTRLESVMDTANLIRQIPQNVKDDIFKYIESHRNKVNQKVKKVFIIKKNVTTWDEWLAFDNAYPDYQFQTAGNVQNAYNNYVGRYYDAPAILFLDDSTKTKGYAPSSLLDKIYFAYQTTHQVIDKTTSAS